MRLAIGKLQDNIQFQKTEHETTLKRRSRFIYCFCFPEITACQMGGDND